MSFHRPSASWSAIIAGALVATSVSVILFALGSGLGFALISPWNEREIAIATFAATTAIWLVVIQWLSSVAAPYIAWRLRTRRIRPQPGTVFFRESARGVVTWTVATVLVAMVLGISLSSIIGAGLHAAERAATSGTMATARSGGSADDAQRPVNNFIAAANEARNQDRSPGR